MRCTRRAGLGALALGVLGVVADAARWRERSGPELAPRASGDLPAIAAQLPRELVRQVLDFAAFRYVVASCHECTSVALWGLVFQDGCRIITGGFDNMAIIWDTTPSNGTCRAMRRLEHAAWVTSVAVLNAGEVVATVSSDGETTMWEARSGKMLRALSEPLPVGADIFSGIEPLPSGEHVAVWRPVGVGIWDKASGEVVHRWLSFPYRTRGVALSAGGDLLVACGGGHAMVWDPGIGEAVATLVDPRATRPHSEEHPAADRARSCFVAVALAGALDPHGFGDGLSWRRLPA